MARNILSVFKVNQNGSYAIIIPAQIARELEITDGSLLTCSKVGNSLHYNQVVIQ